MLLLTAANAQIATDAPVDVKLHVKVNGARVQFADQGPVVINRRVFVPIRGVFARMGAAVQYDAASRAITATGNGRTLTLPLEGERGYVEGRPMRLAERPIVVNDRLLVPLRLLSEALGATVQWDPDRMTVDITMDESAIHVTEGSCARPLRPR